MKEFIVKVSEEITNTYRIKAEDKEQAEGFALDNCDEGIDANLLERTRDRVEVIDTKVSKELVTSKFSVEFVKTITLNVGRKQYRMDIKEIVKFDTDFNGLRFKVVKKRKNEYLEVI